MLNQFFTWEVGKILKYNLKKTCSICYDVVQNEYNRINWGNPWLPLPRQKLHHKKEISNGR